MGLNMSELKAKFGKYINEILQKYEKKYNKKMDCAYQGCADDLN